MGLSSKSNIRDMQVTMTDNDKFTFSIIKHYNSPNSAVTTDGNTVQRTDKIWFGEPDHKFVACAPYDNHFVYDDPEVNKGVKYRWTPMCTCGSPAGIVGYNAYREDASPSSGGIGLTPGELIVCLAHAQYGRHADGSK